VNILVTPIAIMGKLSSKELRYWFSTKGCSTSLNDFMAISLPWVRREVR
jgi:hypothetical protein